jgi:hypothetical protein
MFLRPLTDAASIFTDSLKCAMCQVPLAMTVSVLTGLLYCG